MTTTTPRRPLPGLTMFAWVRTFLASLSLGLCTGLAASAQPPTDPISLLVERQGHTATVLEDGKVLLAGGDSTGTAEIYDPVAQAVASAGFMLSPRTDHTATRLAGQVMVIGGRDDANVKLITTEIYDPAAPVAEQRFSEGPELNVPRAGHSATVLQGGRILVAGGDEDGTAELYDPGTGQFTLLGAQLGTPRAFHGAALLKSGKVLLAGGSGGLSSAEVFTPAPGATGAFAPVANALAVGRVRPTLRVLPDGKVQIIGGATDRSIEVYDPVDNLFGAHAQVLNSSNTPGDVLNTQTRAALIYQGSTLDPEGSTLDPLNALPNRGNYSLTELPQRQIAGRAVNEALVGGGVDSDNQILNSAYVLGSSQASVTTDKLDYAPFTPVTFSGAGWQPGETVEMVLHEEPTTHPDIPIQIGADSQGKFTFDSFAPDIHDIGVTFTLTAWGSLSGYTAQTAFTDDEITNTLDNTIDNQAETLSRKVNESGQVGFYIRPTTGSSDVAGCNVDSSNPAKFNFTVPSGVTASNSSLTFTNCGSAFTQSVTFTAGQVDTFNIQVDIDGTIQGKSGSKWTTNTARFTLVATRRTTSTQVECSPTSVALNNPTTCTATVTDTDAAGTKSAPTGTVNFSLTSGGDGDTGTFSNPGTICSLTSVNSTSSSCSVDYKPTDKGGDSTHTIQASSVQSSVHVGSSNSTGVTVTADSTAPTSNMVFNPAAPNGDNSWYKSNVHVTVSATDDAGGSGVAETRCVLDPGSAPVSFDVIPSGCAYLGAGADVTTDGQHVIYAASKDNAGNKESPKSAAFKIDKTPPQITFDNRTPVPNGNGWNNTNVAVNWTCSDATSGVVSTTESQTVSSEGANQSAIGTCTDNAGNTSSDTQDGINIDKTAPSASATPSPGANANGWNNADVTVTFSGTDGLSGIDSCSAPEVLSTEGAGHSASGTCTDKADNSSAPATASGINIDKTAPTASASAAPPPNGNGWNNTDVTVTFSGTDGLSGIDSCSAPEVLSTEGAGHSASGTCTDKADNSSAPATASGINIDKTGPSVSVTGVTNGASYTLGSVPAAGCSTTDSLSDVATSASASGGGSGVGTFTVTCNGALDKAGNTGTASATYSVIYNYSGFFQPIDNPGAGPTYVFNRGTAGQAFPVKFSLSGNQGLNIFPSGYPKSEKVACTTASSLDELEQTVTAGGSSLSYDPTADQYVYVWKTDKAWANSCRKLHLMLNDGTDHVAYFNLRK